MSYAIPLKSRLGCWTHERWPAELVLRLPGWARRLGWSWTDLRNRRERIERVDDEARRCLWEDSSVLTLPRVFPETGGRLLRHCLAEWPLRWEAAPVPPAAPELSVILPVAGADRLPLFRAVLAGLFGQAGPALEIVVVEHSAAPEYGVFCPPPVRYVHLQRAPGEPFNKSRAMNRGVDASRAPFVLLHDADVFPPAAYASSLVRRLRSGWDAVRPLRFVFYLDEGPTREFLASQGGVLPGAMTFVQQNNPGLSTALAREVYEEVGGHDERFRGWGGEDREFLDRLRTRRLFPGAYAPALHLWHPPAPGKVEGGRNEELLRSLSRLPAVDRIRQLRGGRTPPVADPRRTQSRL